MRRLLSCCLWMSILAVPVPAQLYRSIQVDIPFPFTAGGARLPEGRYRIERDDTRGAAVFVRSAFNRAAVDGLYGACGSDVLVLGPLYTSSWQKPRVVFRKYGENRYFLTQVWDVRSGVEVVRSRQEIELITSRVIAHRRPATRVVIAASVER